MKLFSDENNVTDITDLRIHKYSFDEIKDYKELIMLLQQIENQCGEFENIIVKSLGENKKVSSCNKYSCMKNFVSSFSQNDFEKSDIYELSTKINNYSFIIDCNSKEFIIYQYNFSNNNDLNNDEYYKFPNNLYVKYSKDKLRFYYLNANGEWISDNSLISKIYDVNSEYDVVSADDIVTRKH